MLKNGLIDRDLCQSEIDPCLLYNKKYVIITCADYYLVFYKDDKVLKEIIASLNDTFDLTDEGELAPCLSIEIDIEKPRKNQLNISQPHLITRRLEDFNLHE